MIASLIALVLSLLGGTDAGLIAEPAPAESLIVSAEDGTITVNRVTEDGRVAGTVLTPDGEWFDFGVTSCDPLVLDEDGTEDLSLLFEAGWSGKQEDGMEVLYPQGC